MAGNSPVVLIPDLQQTANIRSMLRSERDDWPKHEKMMLKDEI
jgi:hypothetical protein